MGRIVRDVRFAKVKEGKQGGRPSYLHGYCIIENKWEDKVIELLATGRGSEWISKKLKEKYGIVVSPSSIEEYKKNYLERDPLLWGKLRSLIEEHKGDVAAPGKDRALEVLAGRTFDVLKHYEDMIAELEKRLEREEIADSDFVAISREIREYRKEIVKICAGMDMSSFKEKLIGDIVTIALETLYPAIPEKDKDEVLQRFKARLRSLYNE